MQSPFSLPPLLLAAAYLLGNVSPGLLLARLSGHGDLRRQGSGATGATNAGRLLGKKGFAAVLALDMAKGALAALLPVFVALVFPEGLASGAAAEVPGGAGAVSVESTRLAGLSLACGLSVIAGHVWPALLGFRGGKGIGPFLGVWLAAGFVAWPAFWFAPATLLIAVAGCWPLRPFLRKRASLAALCVLPAQPFLFCLLAGTWKLLPPALAMTLILLHAHRENFRREGD
ncbi:MAG: glycerol-3-phosphate acyltransferase [Puniceicoccales bacterium]|jgi:glycerol-3-phosphate acyltransferase PlsY|nr:glycerol-3-phosphate acyltransferase [Puniceicoccales bacterium]